MRGAELTWGGDFAYKPARLGTWSPTPLHISDGIRVTPGEIFIWKLGEVGAIVLATSARSCQRLYIMNIARAPVSGGGKGTTK